MDNALRVGVKGWRHYRGEGKERKWKGHFVTRMEKWLFESNAV